MNFKKSRFIFLVLGMSVIPQSFANTEIFETIGTTYEIQEESMLDFIMKKLNEKKEAGELENLEKEFREKAIHSIKNPMGVSLPRVIHNNSRYFDPSFVIPEDILLPDGRVLHERGTKVNPLLIKGLSKNLIFIDGTDSEQVEFAIDMHKKSGGKDKIILVQGSFIELMEKHKVRFFFDQTKSHDGNSRTTLVKHFGIKKVPTVIYQETPSTPYLTIQEVSLNDKK